MSSGCTIVVSGRPIIASGSWPRTRLTEAACHCTRRSAPITVTTSVACSTSARRRASLRVSTAQTLEAGADPQQRDQPQRERQHERGLRVRGGSVGHATLVPRRALGGGVQTIQHRTESDLLEAQRGGEGCVPGGGKRLQADRQLRPDAEPTRHEGGAQVHTRSVARQRISERLGPERVQLLTRRADRLDQHLRLPVAIGVLARHLCAGHHRRSHADAGQYQ